MEKNKDGSKLYWTCARKKTCKARVHTVDGQVMFRSDVHTHAPDTAGAAPRSVVNYFEDNFIGRPDRRGNRRNPLFPLTLWNINQRVVEALSFISCRQPYVASKMSVATCRPLNVVNAMSLAHLS